MPDPTVSDALAEAYATAPADELVYHTLELRHPAFVDATGRRDSVWLVADNQDLLASVESGAPVRGGLLTRFVAFPFSFSLAPIEAGSLPEIQLVVSSVNRLMVEQLDLAVAAGEEIVAVYRPYLDSDKTAPQMIPAPSFVLSDVKVTVMRVSARARTSVDLRGAFPRRLYTAALFPGLIGR